MSELECALFDLLKDLAKGIPIARLVVGSGNTAYLPKDDIKEILKNAGYASEFIEDVNAWDGPIDSCNLEAPEVSTNCLSEKSPEASIPNGYSEASASTVF